MSGSPMNFDRYHATMFKSALTEHSRFGQDKVLAHKESVFYVTQRKIPYAPCVGHERLLESLVNKRLDVPRLRFLRQEKADLSLVADNLDSSESPFSIRAVRPGTIIFAGEPFADIKGPFGLTQMMEVKFEHAFDEPITVAGNAMGMRLEAGDRHLSDFSLRRDGCLESALDAAKYSYIGGFDDTSNMEAAFMLDINPVGTMAHYWVQAYYDLAFKIFTEEQNGKQKHFQQIAFERFLDANPNGTTLLVDTIDLRHGMIHAIRAAQSSQARRNALKFIRIDSGDLIVGAQWARAMLDINSLKDVNIMLTSDLDKQSIREIVKHCPFVSGFGVGTKLKAETTIAGVIFKLCLIEKRATLKCSETKGKETIPGVVQIWRCTDEDGFYVKDIVAMIEEAAPRGNFKQAAPLLERFYEDGRHMVILSPEKQKKFVHEQLRLFKNIDEYPVELSDSLKTAKENMSKRMRHDEMGEDGVIMVDYPK